MLFIDFPGIWDRVKRRYWIIDSVSGQLRHDRAIQIGYTGPIAARRAFTLRGRDLFCHKHIIGKTGYGKSNLLLNMAKQLIQSGVGVALIDPHADLANDLLWSLLDEGYFHRPDIREDPTKRLLYIDFDIVNEKDEPQYFLPLNILKQPYDKYKISRTFVEICRRVWGYLRDGAPQFENILLNSLIVLIDNDLPLTRLQKLINEKEYRDSLLQNVTDPDVVGFFKYRFDRWNSQDAPKMVESTLNKVMLLTFSPVLRYSLGQPTNALNFEEIINSGTSVIFNLGGLDEETRRFVSCLLTIGFEQATYARKKLEKPLRQDFFIFVDEFQDSVSLNQASFNMFLSEARKYRVWFVGANQYLGQIPPELLQGLQNTMRISLRLEDDSLDMAQKIGKYNPDWDKRQPEDEEARKRTNPLPYNVQEEYELLANEIKELFVGEGFVKLEHRKEKFKALRIPPPTTAVSELIKLREWYARRLMIGRSQALDAIDQSRTPNGAATPAENALLLSRKRYG
jgi:hypothetical protein